MTCKYLFLTDEYKNRVTDFAQKDEVLTYLIHLGYLAYDEESHTCRIPNNGIRMKWGWLMGFCSRYRTQAEMVKLSRRIYEATISLDASAVAEGLSKSHELLTGCMSYNNEQSLQSAVMLSYFYAYNYYTVIPECPSGKGYADIVMIPFVPGKPALVIELKKDKCACGAIEQIKAKNYPSRLEKFRGNIILAGINYDSTTKEHTAVPERA